MIDLSEYSMKARIKAPDHFADEIMKRIALEKAGGLKALPSASRVLVFATIFTMYSSLGIFLGVQSYRNSEPDKSTQRRQALIVFRNTHHLNTLEKYDQVFKPFNPGN